MEITITETAQQKISQLTQDQTGVLKLKYETEGLGCVMNGLPSLWFVKEDTLHEDDELVQTNFCPVLMEKSKRIFLADTLKIDFSTSANTFQLKSPEQIINGRMSFKLFPKEKGFGDHIGESC